jgi:hypothetical protein
MSHDPPDGVAHVGISIAQNNHPLNLRPNGIFVQKVSGMVGKRVARFGLLDSNEATFAKLSNLLSTLPRRYSLSSLIIPCHP